MKDYTISKEAFCYALMNFGKGEIFEEFALSFLSIVYGEEFIPVGKVKDKGIDGYLKFYHRLTYENIIFQISTEADYNNKIIDSIYKLIRNNIRVDQFTYVTSRRIPDKNNYEDHFLKINKKPLKIIDVDWFALHVITEEKLVLLYQTYIESNIHEFIKPDKQYVVGDIVKDPRFIIFMRQQFDSSDSNLAIESKLADTLILHGLEGTASEKNILRSRDDIKEKIAQLVKFNPKCIYDTIDYRLKELSRKPRQIHHHQKEDKYCLPYETRLKLIERDIEEYALFEAFKKQTTEQLKAYLKEDETSITRALELIEQTIHKIYHKQGLEFSAFVIEGQSKDIFEGAIPEIVGQVVDESHIVLKNKNSVKKALLMTIRNISYNGTKEQKEYLRRLSETYTMMFLLKWDPQLAVSFQKIASQLKIFVCTSILIPALSEIYLDASKRRYWTLLEGAYQAGVQLTINKIILDELVTHFKMIKSIYKSEYEATEEIYLSDEMNVLYVDDMLIRAYLYAKSRKQVSTFKQFLNEFANSNLKDAHRDLMSFLEEVFHIKYEDTTSIETQLDQMEIKLLTNGLTEIKKSKDKALTDSKIILMIYKIRELNHEDGSRNAFGYKTWWLSQDVNTYKAVQSVFNDRYAVNCYIRSDFLYNYISLAPKRQEIDNMFKQVFPSMLGINLSYHMPKEICTHINKQLLSEANKSIVLKKRAIRQFTERLISNPTRSTKKIMTFFDEELKKVTDDIIGRN